MDHESFRLVPVPAQASDDYLSGLFRMLESDPPSERDPAPEPSKETP